MEFTGWSGKRNRCKLSRFYPRLSAGGGLSFPRPNPGRSGIELRLQGSQTSHWHIFRRLEADFPNGQVFLDVDKIPLGEDFRHVLDTEIRGSHLVLVVIGRGWLEDPD